MKRIITSAGLVVVGAASLQATGYAPGFASTDPSKPWSVGVTMSGFYDSNPLTYPNGGFPNPNGGPNLEKIESWGYEISPYLSGAYSTDQTQLGARYTFSLDYYNNFPNNKNNYSHIFTLFGVHQFNPRTSLSLNNNFTYSQEPEVLATAGGTPVPYRTQGNNLANNANLNLAHSLTETMKLVLGYSNTYLDYEEDSLGGLLDRLENYGIVNLEYSLNPQAVLLGGFQFGQINYTADQVIGLDSNGQPLYSDSRNSRNYYMYVGGSYAFNPDLSASLKGGAQYADSYNAPGSSYTQWNPYFDISGKWNFSSKGSLQLGLNESFTQTYVLAANASTMGVYLNASYNLTEKLVASALGKLYHSRFNGGIYDNQDYNFWMTGLNLSYNFNRHLSFDAGVNYDRLISDSSAVYPYTRTRPYFGFTARY